MDHVVVFFPLATLLSLPRSTSKQASLAWGQHQQAQEREGRRPTTGVPPLSQATSTNSRCWSSRSEVLLYLSYQSAASHHTRIDHCAPDGSTHAKANSMALWYFWVLTLASPYISWHKLEEFVTCQSIQQSLVRAGNLNLSVIIKIVKLVFLIITRYYIASCYVQGHNARQEVPRYTQPQTTCVRHLQRLLPGCRAGAVARDMGHRFPEINDRSAFNIRPARVFYESPEISIPPKKHQSILCHFVALLLCWRQPANYSVIILC